MTAAEKGEVMQAEWPGLAGSSQSGGKRVRAEPPKLCSRRTRQRRRRPNSRMARRGTAQVQPRGHHGAVHYSTCSTFAPGEGRRATRGGRGDGCSSQLLDNPPQPSRRRQSAAGGGQGRRVPRAARHDAALAQRSRRPGRGATARRCLLAQSRSLGRLCSLHCPPNPARHTHQPKTSIAACAAHSAQRVRGGRTQRRA